MKLSHVLVGGAFAAALLSPSVANAGVRLGLGGDYWVNRSALFNLTLTAEGAVSRVIHIGGRFGALVTTSPGTGFGVPIDLSIRANLARSRLYSKGWSDRGSSSGRIRCARTQPSASASPEAGSRSDSRWAISSPNRSRVSGSPSTSELIRALS